MELIGLLLIGKPLHIVLPAVAFLVLYLVRRHTSAGRPATRWPLVAAAAWLAFAAWEWAVLVYSPESNIRVDLLLIVPALAIVSAWALYRCFR